MDFYEVVNKRQTTRDFENAPIDDEVIRRIIDAGMKAPANGRLRNWQFIVIKDKSVVTELLHLVPDNVTRADVDKILTDWNVSNADQKKGYIEAIPKQHRMLAEASCMIIPLFDPKVDLLHPDNLSHLNGLASMWCCIENMFLATVAEGYALTLRIPLGDEGEWSRKVLGYPNNYVMPCFIAVGTAKADAKHSAMNNYSLDNVIHQDRW